MFRWVKHAALKTSLLFCPKLFPPKFSPILFQNNSKFDENHCMKYKVIFKRYLKTYSEALEDGVEVESYLFVSSSCRRTVRNHYS